MGFSVVCLHGRWGERQKKKDWGGVGEGRGSKETLAEKLLDFGNLVCQEMEPVFG